MTAKLNIPANVLSDLNSTLSRQREAAALAAAAETFFQNRLYHIFEAKALEVLAAAQEMVGDGVEYHINNRWWDGELVINAYRISFQLPDSAVDWESGLGLLYPDWEVSEAFLRTPALELAQKALCFEKQSAEKQRAERELRHKVAGRELADVERAVRESGYNPEAKLQFKMADSGLYYVATSSHGVYRIDPMTGILSWKSTKFPAAFVFLDSSEAPEQMVTAAYAHLAALEAEPASAL